MVAYPCLATTIKIFACSAGPETLCDGFAPTVTKRAQVILCNTLVPNVGLGRKTIFRSIPQWYMGTGNRIWKGTRPRANREEAILNNPLSLSVTYTYSCVCTHVLHTVYTEMLRQAKVDAT
eukprot:COSAG02_NODE_1491_length_12358_cov_52.348014_2_plen_121_part_00